MNRTRAVALAAATVSAVLLAGVSDAATATAVPVVAVPSSTDPIVNLRVVFRAGSRLDPPGKEGLTRLSAALMVEGTRSHSSSRLRKALFPWAADLDVQVDKDATVFVGRVHRDHLDRFLSLFLQILQSPRLDPSDFERVRDAQENALTRQLRTASDELLVRELLEAELYGSPSGHPYRHPPLGTEKGIAAITLDDVRRHIAATFTSDRALLGISGGYLPRQRDLIEAAINALPRSAAPAPTLPKPAPIDRSTVLIVEKPAPGTPISLGFHIELARDHPDYAAMKLAETYFGEHRNRVGHLFNAMREVRGLNYGDYAYVEHFVQQGWSTLERTNIGREQQYFSIWIRPVEHTNRHFATRQAVFELQRFVERGIPSDDKLAEVKAFVSGYWRSKEQEPMRRLGYLLDDEFAGTPGLRDALKRSVQTLTRAEVNAAIKRHLRADRLRIVIVTDDGAACRRALVDNTPSPITYPAAVPQWVLDEDKTITSLDLGLSDDQVRVVRPEALFVE